MNKFCESLQNQMLEALHQIALEADTELERASKSRDYLNGTMATLNDFVTAYEFNGTPEEIRFFKEQKPVFYSELIYWNEIVFYETNLPAGRKRQVAFYNKGLERINDFSERHSEIYKYHKLRGSQHDDLLFLRETDCKPLISEENVEVDQRVSTVFSTILSKLIAFDRLAQTIQLKIKDLKAGNEVPTVANEGKLRWTGTKAQLIELIYALGSSGVINHGKPDIKQLFILLTKVFNIEITHYYPYFQRMRIKKKDRAQFMNLLADCLIRRMDESDENPRYA